MEGLRGTGTSTKAAEAVPLLHTAKPLPQTTFNRLFAPVYACAIVALLYHHATMLLHSTSLLSFSIALTLLVSDLVLTFIWTTIQAFRMCPIHRQEYPQSLEKIIKRADFPALDVFICTADPYKEPPVRVVNTALSLMAYDYPTEKISVYVSDDGGSALTLFAFMEAAKFACHWLPFCKKNNIVDRSPDAYFESNHSSTSEFQEIKMMYESMKVKVEDALERGQVSEQYLRGHQKTEAFNKWTDNFTRQDHPAVIQVLLDTSKDKDINGDTMPNLIYVSREKNKGFPHHFKAGALNVLLRVSAVMTNAPIILTQDCDVYSNDPRTPLRAFCYLCDPSLRSTLAYVQFPQIFRGLNKNDIYAGAYRALFTIHTQGHDGLKGPEYLGSSCFFRRRALFGAPSSVKPLVVPELGPDNVVGKPIQSQSVLELAHHVASCKYEDKTNWGSKIGVRYGSLVEDYHTGYKMQCEGWKSVLCYPDRPAFYGDAPISLIDVLNQQKRWSVGLLEVAFSRDSPVTLGISALGTLMALGYAHLAFWSAWAIPVITYSFLPQLALLNKVYIFPKAFTPWFLLYVFLFLGAYAQDLLDFVIDGGTLKQWWNDQRFWYIRALTCYLFGSIEFCLKFLGISSSGFNVTSKVIDDEQSKRYEQGIFDFGVHSPMFVALTLAAIINLISLAKGFVEVFRGSNLEDLLGQMLVSGLVVAICWPIYEAVALRSDNGKIPTKTTIMAALLACTLYVASSLVFS